MYFLYVVFYFNKKLKAKKKNIQSPNDLLGIQEVDNKLMINITVQKCYGKSEAGKKKRECTTDTCTMAKQSGANNGRKGK